MKMFIWKHRQSPCVFVQVGGRTLGAKDGDTQWSELKEFAIAACFLDGVEDGIAVQGAVPSPIEVRGILMMGRVF